MNTFLAQVFKETKFQQKKFYLQPFHINIITTHNNAQYVNFCPKNYVSVYELFYLIGQIHIPRRII